MSDLLRPAPATSYAPPPPPLAGLTESAADASVKPPAPAASSSAEAAQEVPRDTTPTWELELLVSGAVLFGLFQVPPAVTAAWTERLPHLTVVGAAVGSPFVLMVLVVFYGLIGCFVLHLGLRAYWVALVGVHSVFPHGVRWEKAREYGPYQSRLNQTRVRPLPEFIGRVDNAASLVFASGFVLGAGVLAAAATLGALGLFAWAMTSLLGARRGLVVAAAVYFPVMLLFTLAPLVDMKFGERIDPASRLGRALAAVIRLAQGTLPAGVRSLLTVISSNVPKRLVWAATAVGMAGAMVAAFRALQPPSPDLTGAKNYAYFNGGAPGASLPPMRYASLRGPWEASRRGPSIDGEVVTGPYLRLFVPYRTELHNDALPAACPSLTPIDALPDDYGPAQQAAVGAVLECAARVHAVAVDGRPVDGLRYHFSEDPRTNRRGFVAFVPVSALAPGEHRLEVSAVRPVGYRGALPPYVIPFWR